jgi:hypothetical protein
MEEWHGSQGKGSFSHSHNFHLTPGLWERRWWLGVLFPWLRLHCNYFYVMILDAFSSQHCITVWCVNVWCGMRKSYFFYTYILLWGAFMHPRLLSLGENRGCGGSTEGISRASQTKNHPSTSPRYKHLRSGKRCEINHETIFHITAYQTVVLTLARIQTNGERVFLTLYAQTLHLFP